MVVEPDMPIPPEEQPRVEAGQGEAEGFEQAERELIENAEGSGSPQQILEDQFSPEESEGPVGTYGEADDVEEAEADRRDPDETL